MINQKKIAILRFKTCKLLPFASNYILCVPVTTGKLLTKLRLRPNQIILSEEIFDELEEKEIIRVFVQGLFYFILDHDKRAKSFVFSPKTRMIWNLASEIAISELLDDLSDLAVSKKLFLDATDIDALRDKSVEYYFSVISDTIDQLNLEGQMDAQESLSDFAGSSSQDSKDSEASEFSEREQFDEDGFRDAEENSEDYQSEFDYESLEKEALRNFLKEMVGKSLYSMCDELRYFAKDLDPRLDRNAKKLINLLKSISRRGPGLITKGRKPRRRLPEGAPDLVKYVRKGFGRTAIIVDVSLSVHEFLDDIYTAVAKTIRICNNVDVFIGDTAILETQYNVHSPNQLKSLPIGGGTAMDVIIEQVDQEGYHNIVLISDGQTDWPSSETKANLVYVPVGPYADIMNVPSWVKVK
ncbi:MAG: hypothetical protein KatS3mg087_0066 [Patescibacteria group bacterium]|nr:MAG: hypothetical protein KatS3mg087_0066 [Patescibacteria group bacterium]